MRFSDDIQRSVSPDFVPRAHNKPLRRLMLAYLLAIITISIINVYGHTLGGTLAAVLIIAILASLAVYALLFSQRNNDMRMATEFENMLFAASASAGAVFTIFIKHDGSIVYADDGTKRTFPRFAYDESRALDALIDDRVNKADIERIYSALTTNKSERLIVPITINNEESQFILLIEPLRRPVGYFVLRGRNYYPERTNVVKRMTSMGTATPEKIEKLLEQIAANAYITDQHGTFEYCSKPLAALLGYSPEEMIENKLGLSQIIYEADGYTVGEFGITDFSGNVLLQNRKSSLTKAILQQQVFRDDEGKQSGCIGTLIETA